MGSSRDFEVDKMMKYKLTDKMYQLKKSAMAENTLLARQNLKLGGKIINFASGYPAEEALNEKMVQKYLNLVMEEHGKEILQYGPHAGYQRLRDTIKAIQKSNGKYVEDKDGIIVTFGATEALGLIVHAIINPGDRIIVEEPTYCNFVGMARLYGAELVGVPFEEDGVNIERLEDEMKRGVKLFYTIPDFHNPTGMTTGQKKRRAICELAKKYGTLVIEDDPYGHLRYEGKRLPSIKEMDNDGYVIYVRSFSKLISPGLRIGYIIAESELCDKLAKLKGLTNNAVCSIAQYVLDEILSNENIELLVDGMISLYQRRLTTMIESIKAYWSPEISYFHPSGGMYLWAGLPTCVSQSDFCKRAARELHVPVTPGDDFYADNRENCQMIRLNFVREKENEIQEGIELLGDLASKMMR